IEDITVVDCISDGFDFYIDALFGIGLNRSLTPEIKALINTVNEFKGVKVAVDIPSGILADGGSADTVFNADLTVTFIGYKIAQLLPATSDYCGEIVLNDLGIDTENNYSYQIIEAPHPKKFSKNAHKGTFGTALLICGSYGMCGASVLAAKAALTAGAGLVKSIICDKNYTAFTSAVPEAITVPVETAPCGAPIIYEKTFISAAAKAGALLIGCGLGSGDQVTNLVKKILSLTNIPTVIDADGINAVAQDISILGKSNAPLILTPHPAEMARLCKTTVADIENNRILYAKTLACSYNCVVVLKGANTIVADKNGELYFNIIGNYGMGKGGSGDVLSGIITALLANGYEPLEAALSAVYVHSAAGDRAAEKYTRRTMLPSDIIKEVKHISF
ncbi:MAG: NAD(P)H-hydrate dehydratase, partial [Clostridia bacterium]|nr:NAD(P)H-hydrate dehydratase [Clostridia bacterium]